ncbi:MAG: hypothetical protein QXL26_01515, partial [Zestosphaera sp.]
MVRFISYPLYIEKTRTIFPNPTLCGIGVTRLRPGAELNPAEAGNVALNLPETLALQSGEEVRSRSLSSKPIKDYIMISRNIVLQSLRLA